MSQTAVLTMASAPLSTSASSATATTTSCCPGCGYLLSSSSSSSSAAAAQARIQDLEAQVRHLNQKAAAAADRWSAYEAELTKLRSQHATSSSSSQPSEQLDPSSTTAAAAPSPSPTRSSFLTSAPGRISALLYPRKSTANIRADGLPSSTTGGSAGGNAGGGGGGGSANTTEDLLEALTREKTLRREAEGRLSATSKEVEELSASLFEQANEMVADERRARARLEQRVGELERRDVDKRKRLDRLEVAMMRIERVKKMLEDK